MTCGNERFWKIRENEVEDANLDMELQKFYEFEGLLKKNGLFTPETTYCQRRTTYVYTWMQTDQAIVMLLSNNTIQVSFDNYCESQLSNESHFARNFVHFQINFTQNHKKVLISPIEQKITFIRNKMTSNNFRTLTFTALAKRGFSLHSFAMFKYVTAVVQLLALRLTDN